MRPPTTLREPTTDEKIAEAVQTLRKEVHERIDLAREGLLLVDKKVNLLRDVLDVLLKEK